MLNERAKKFLEEHGAISNVKTILTDDETIETTFYSREIPGKYKTTDVLNGDRDLPGYMLTAREKVYEFEQCSCYCGGSISFTALKRDDGSDIPESLWTDEEIDSIIG